jgi:S1-C subfamily serine protease
MARSKVLLLLAFASAAGPAWAQQAPPPDILTRVSRSVVRISMVDGAEEQGNGTGFVVRKDGIVVTNHHVVDDAGSDFVAIFRDGTRRKVLGSLALDEEHDLALIRIEGGDYQALDVAPTAGIKVGQHVFLIGSSSGLDQSLGTGIVAALRPDGFPEEWRKRYREAGRKIVAGPILQHTASSSPGSSGSPIVDLQGNVVAVHHSGIYGWPIYFGAHADALRALLARTNLDARPRPLGPNVARNLLISAAVLLAIGALFAAPALFGRLSRRAAVRGQRFGR